MITAQQALQLSQAGPNLNRVQEKVEQWARNGYTYCNWHDTLSEPQINKLKALGYQVTNTRLHHHISWGVNMKFAVQDNR